MPLLFLMRHAESEANVHNILAGQQDFALSAQGRSDAAALAGDFTARFRPRILVCSPLRRARETMAPFSERLHIDPTIDPRVIEQNLGRFSGMTYAQAEADPAYNQDRRARWDWRPDGGGESYRVIADRVQSFLNDAASWNEDALVVTHAVAMRLFRACLEQTLPNYPEHVAANGEVWRCDLSRRGTPGVIETLHLGHHREHKA